LRVGAIDPGGSIVSQRSSIVTSLVIIVIVCGSVGGLLLMTNPYEPSKVAVIVMDPGFGDLSMADNIRLGMTTVGYDVAIQYYIPEVLPTSVSEAQQIMNDLAATGMYSLIIAIGADMHSAVQAVANLYPAQKFGLIGASINADNVASATFASEQASFLSGVLAAFQAAEDEYSGIVGILAAMENDATINPLINGFIQGVEAANSTYNLNVTLMDTEFIGAWNDTTTASTIIYRMFAVDNASIIFAPVRASIIGVRLGVLQAAVTVNFQSPMRSPLIIAAEGDLDYYGCNNPEIPTAPTFITTSVVSRTDLAVYHMINMTLWDEFEGTLETYNLANGGVNITTFLYSSTYISEEIIETVWLYHDHIVNGTIIVNP